MNRFRENSFAPVKVGEELDVKIEAVGEKGDGIAKKNGFVLFVPNTKTGDEVKIRVTKVLKKVGFAEVVDGSKKKSEEEPKAAEEEYDASQDSEDFGETEEEPAEEKTEEPAAESDDTVDDTSDDTADEDK